MMAKIMLLVSMAFGTGFRLSYLEFVAWSCARYRTETGYGEWVLCLTWSFQFSWRIFIQSARFAGHTVLTRDTSWDDEIISIKIPPDKLL